MRVRRALYEQFAPGSDESLFYRSLDIRLAEMALGAGRFGVAQWIIDRLLFLIRAHQLEGRIARRTVTEAGGAVWAYDPGSTSPTVRAYRDTFLERCVGVSASFIGGNEPAVAADVPTRHQASSTARHMAWRALLDFTPQRWRWLVDVYSDIALIAPLRATADVLYVFQLSYARPYLVASWLDAHTSISIRLVVPGVPLFRDNRFVHLECPLVLTSRVQEPEIDYFRSRGWVRARNAAYAGPEFALDLLDIPEGAPSVDVGFFSSGEWARIGGLIQSPDLDAIARGDYEGNQYAGCAEQIVGSLAEHCKSRGLTLRLYPHPYERALMNLHGITPPYAKFADGDLVTLDIAEGTSRSRIYEPNIAVSVQSSFIWERLDRGLRRSFIHAFGDESLDVVLPESLGEYRANVFMSTGELLDKIDLALGEAGATA